MGRGRLKRKKTQKKENTLVKKNLLEGKTERKKERIGRKSSLAQQNNLI